MLKVSILLKKLIGEKISFFKEKMGYWIESAITVTYLLFSSLCWCIGHLIFRIFTKCSEEAFFGCSGKDFIGLITLFSGSILYFRILRHIVFFFVKGKLPDGEDIMKNFSGMFQGNREQRRYAQKANKK